MRSIKSRIDGIANQKEESSEDPVDGLKEIIDNQSDNQNLKMEEI